MLKISGLPYPMIVVSNDFFNQEGKIIACPIVRNAAEGPLHINSSKIRRMILISSCCALYDNSLSLVYRGQ